MANLKQIKFNNLRNYEDIDVAVKAALKFEELVENDAAAEQWFKAAGMSGTVLHNIILSTQVSVWDENMQGEETYKILIKEHYIDPGSMDYVYSYLIS